MRTPSSAGTAPTVAANANNSARHVDPASGATGALPVSVPATPPSTTGKFVSASSQASDNIFGRIRKACSVKTKFATSSLKHSIQSSPTPPLQSSMTTSKSKESKVHNGSSRDKSPSKMLKSAVVAESANHPSNTGPVITGAVTKLPPASSMLNCSPSKQLLNSLFSNIEPEQKLNNQHYQVAGHYAHLMPPPHQHRHYGPAFYLDPATGVPMQAPSGMPVENHIETTANSSKLRQSTSHDSLLNVTLRKKKKDSCKTSTSGHSSPRHSTVTGGNNGQVFVANNTTTTTTPRQLNNYGQPASTDTADLARKEGVRQDYSNHPMPAQGSVLSHSNSCNSLSPVLPLSQSSSQAQGSSLLSPSATGSSLVHCCKRCHGHFALYQPSGSSGATEHSTSALGGPPSTTLTTVPSELLSSARYDDSTDGSQYTSTDQFSLDSSSVTSIPNNHPNAVRLGCTCAETTLNSPGQTTTASSTSTLRTLYNNIGPSKSVFLENLRHSHAHTQLGSQTRHNLNDVASHKESNVNSSKLYYKPFTLAPKMRRSISKDSIDDKYLDLDDYLKTGNMKNLHAMNQVRDSNLKNQNHEYNNIHQYILQIQKEKQELQNQLVSLVANADAKRLEIEKLQKELKQVKEKYVQSKKREDSCQDGSEEASARPKVYVEADEVKKDDVKLLEERLQCEARSETEDKVNQEFDAQPGTSCMSASSFVEWDKQSSSSISELSVANLQDRINQMEETHYSTSEELQATLQELNDMHVQVAELQMSNEQLEIEKSFLYETLCTQTKKLESYQSRLDQMQSLILDQYENEEKRAALTPTEREEHLVQLLRQCQTDRDELAAHKVQLEEELEEFKKNAQMEREHPDFGLYNELFLKSDDRVTSELYHYSSDFDKKSTEGEMIDEVEELDSGAANVTDDDKKEGKANEMTDRLPIKLHSAKSLQEISHTAAGSFHSLDGLATRDPTTNEDTIEMLQFLVKQLQDRIAQKEEDLKKLKERIILMESEHKDEITKLEVQLKNIENRNKELNERNEELYQRLKSTEEAKIESEIRAQKNLDEKREIRTLLEEKDRRLADLEMRLSSKSKELSELDDKVALEQAEWKQFQQDLLTTVRVANDFKHETMAECKKLQCEKHLLEERLMAVEAELQKYKNDKKKLQFTLRANVSNGTESGQAATANGPVASVNGSTVKSSELGSSGSSTKSTLCKTPPSSKTSLLTMRMQSYEPPGSNSSSITTSPSRSLSRSNSSQISVRSLIESIESHSKQKQSASQSPSQSSSSPSPSGAPPLCNRSNSVPLGSNSTHYELIQRHLRLDSNTNGVSSTVTSPSPELRSKSSSSSSGTAPTTILKESSKSNGEKSFKIYQTDSIRARSSELANTKMDPLSTLVRGGGSKRNALLKWCTNKTIGYRNIDITNFSSSWNDGMAFCAILHTYLPEKIPYETLTLEDKQRNFTIAFKAAESVGISTTLDLNEMLSQERPDWHKIMAYVTSIYTHFET